MHLSYGGTFDPVHNGHLAVARDAGNALGVPVWLTPAADPPHRAPPGASAGQRAAMLERALDGQGRLRMDLRELRRADADPERRSWTIDTLHELRGELGPHAPIALLLGADSFVGLPSWRDWRELFALAHFVVADRPGSPLDGGLPAELAQILAERLSDSATALETAPAGRIWRLQQPLRPESATDIRRRIVAGQPWRGLVPAAVADYILAHGLYGAGGATPGHGPSTGTAL
ncbi:nicotinic acid mononucleotide adenylyltransferase [Pseudoxanthomonas kalamensis DSM 18571]|nr:nicotinic acid mononucleotide adenylyltransferase [Pseudoxanthomonas kalamensis DSM 18571]